MGIIVNGTKLQNIQGANGTYWASGTYFNHDLNYLPSALMLENTTRVLTYTQEELKSDYGITAYPTSYGTNNKRCVAADSGWEYDADNTYVNIYPYINISNTFYTSIYTACRTAISTSYRIYSVNLLLNWDAEIQSKSGWLINPFEEDGSSTYSNSFGYSGTGYPCNWWYGNDIHYDSSKLSNFYNNGPGTYGYNHIQNRYNWSSSYSNQTIQSIIEGSFPGSTFYGVGTSASIKFHGGTLLLYYALPYRITCRLSAVSYKYATSQTNFNNGTTYEVTANFYNNSGGNLTIVSSPAYYVYRPGSTSYVYSTQLSTPSTYSNVNSSGKGTIGYITIGSTKYYVHMANINGGGTGSSISTNLTIDYSYDYNHGKCPLNMANNQALTLNTSSTN